MKNNKISASICIMTLFLTTNQASMEENFLDRRSIEHLPSISKIDTSFSSDNCTIFSLKRGIDGDSKECNSDGQGKHQSPNSIIDCGKNMIQSRANEIGELDMCQLESLSLSKADDIEGAEDKIQKRNKMQKHDSTVNSPSKMKQGKCWFGVDDKIILNSRRKSRSASKKHKRHFGDNSDYGYDPDKGKFDKRSEYHRLAELEKALEESEHLISSSNSDDY